MPSSEIPAEKMVFTEVDSLLKRLHKSWTTLKKARQEWDFKTSKQSLASVTEHLDQMRSNWDQQSATLQAGITADQTFVLSDQYPQAVEAAFQQAGIPLKGEFPIYEFPPFRLIISRETATIRLSMGRKSQQMNTFAPEQLAQRIATLYKQVIDSKFDPDRFCRELLHAYEFLNRLSLNSNQILWGHPVPLKDIHKLLTLRHAAKQDYPEPLFIFDLARLKEQVEIRYDGHRFELIPSRNQSSGLLLVSSRGQESRVSSLAIYAAPVESSP
jgi:hypothetical protein